MKLIAGITTLLHYYCIIAPYHHARGHSNPPATVSVRNNVAVADAEEGDGYQPHRVQQVSVLLVMVPAITIHWKTFLLLFDVTFRPLLGIISYLFFTLANLK